MKASSAGFKRALDGRTAFVPAVHDAFSARLAAEAGCPAVCLGSSTVSNALLGVPDGGFLTLTDMTYLVGKISPYSSVPVLVDADNGFGNAVNVVHTVRSLEAAGAGGIMIEDQVAPPRTPSVARDIPVIPRREAIAKMRAACEARDDPDFFVIGRTDSMSAEGIDGAIERAKGFADVGVDCIFVSGQRTRSDLERI